MHPAQLPLATLWQRQYKGKEDQMKIRTYKSPPAYKPSKKEQKKPAPDANKKQEKPSEVK